MALRNLLLTGAAIVALGAGAGRVLADDQDAHARQTNSQHLTQVNADGMPATTDEQARTERTPRDMSPDTRMAQMGPSRPMTPMTRPMPPTTGTETKSISLSQVDQPDRTLVNAPVESKDGHKVGEVAKVTLDAHGKANEVVLNDAAATHIAASKLVFQPDRGVLITELTPSDLAPAKGSQDAPHSAPPR